MGNGGVGELPSMLFLVPLTFPGDEESVRSRAGRARGSAHAGQSPPGERSVSDYSIQFRTLAAECEWNEKAQ